MNFSNNIRNCLTYYSTFNFVTCLYLTFPLLQGKNKSPTKQDSHLPVVLCSAIFTKVKRKQTTSFLVNIKKKRKKNITLLTTVLFLVFSFCPFSLKNERLAEKFIFVKIENIPYFRC